MAVEQGTRFLEDFLFGAATAGHQVGDNVNGRSNWNEYERDNAFRLAKESRNPEKDYGNGPLSPEARLIIGDQPNNPNNYVSGDASGWWSGYWDKDLDIAQDLGLQAIRFSIERAQVQPTHDLKLDPRAIDHYRRLIKGCRDRRIVPIVTLFHFVDPQWFSEAGGWENKELARKFPEYVRELVRALGEGVNFYITINEPEVFTSKGWFEGVWPPQKQGDLRGALKVRRNLIDAHKESYDVIKEVYGDDPTQVTAAINLVHHEAASGGPLDWLGRVIANKLTNGMYLPKMVHHMDLIGVNHYMYNVRRGLDPRKGNFQNEGGPRSDLGWYLNPESLYKVLTATARRYKKPIMVTEHGLADSEDRYRAHFIRDSLAEVLKANQDGADIRGYLYWSLVDNFEWDKGFWPRFGLIGVEYATQKRIIRPSAYEYLEIIRSRTP